MRRGNGYLWRIRLLLLLSAAAFVPACGSTGSAGAPGNPGPPGPPGPPGSADAWSRLGDAGTVDGTNFLGTTDNVALDVRVNNTRALRLEPTANAPNVIGGSHLNSVTPGVTGATIGGGGGSGFFNSVTGNTGTISGGNDNQAGPFAAVGGGTINTASGSSATVSGGTSNVASGPFSVVAGGNTNTASGGDSIVAGGSSNTAGGDSSFAAGFQANAAHNGTFVWSDVSGTATTSTAANQFIARASGGYTLFSSSVSLGVTLAPGSGAWASISDRNSKENVVRVNGRETLETLAKMPISTWNYKTQTASIRHMGPMAQDFHAAFNVGEDDKHITTIDAEGVSLSAIQGLYELLREKEGKIAELERENRSMKARVAAIEKALGLQK